jgi:hypothetical protein
VGGEIASWSLANKIVAIMVCLQCPRASHVSIVNIYQFIITNKIKQAGAKLCQAQSMLGLEKKIWKTK